MSGAGGGDGGTKVSEKDKAELADLKQRLGSETMYSLKWLEIQKKYKTLYRKLYGEEKAYI